MHDVLVEHLHASAVVVGENFRFGHKAAGDVALLERLGRTFGFTVEGAPLVAERRPATRGLVDLHPQSCVDAGDVAAAAGRWAGRTGWRASWSAATARAASSASRPPTCSPRRTRRCRPTGCTRPG